MKHIKVWKVLGELTKEEVEWLFYSKYDVHIERNELHFTQLTGSHSQVTMPDITKIIVRTYNDAAETMLCLKFGDRVRLVSEIWEDEFRGCQISF